MAFGDRIIMGWKQAAGDHARDWAADNTCETVFYAMDRKKISLK